MRILLYSFIFFYFFIFLITLKYSPYFSILKVASVSIHLFYDISILAVHWLLNSILMLIENQYARVYITGSFIYMLM
jgi:hypothetical protein